MLERHSKQKAVTEGVHAILNYMFKNLLNVANPQIMTLLKIDKVYLRDLMIIHV